MEGHLLQVLPSVIKDTNGELEIEYDSSESLRLYLDHFEKVTIACPVRTQRDDAELQRGRSLANLPWEDRVRIVRLPDAYHYGAFLRNFFSARRRLRAEIERADYLVFSPHTLIGDWPTVAIREAVKLRRPYVIEADVVYEKVAQIAWSRDATWKRLAKNGLLNLPFRYSHRYCLQNSALALLQGEDVYRAFSSFCSNPHKVYHMPISRNDYITDAQLKEKLTAVKENRPLRLCYIGRCIDMKGPLDWLRTLHALLKDNVSIRASWFGDGPLLPAMKAMAKELGIADVVSFHGHVLDRDKIFSALCDSDIFLFCHLTPESPRCLVEALASGCPLVGYGSAYPKDLVAERGGGQFAMVGNWRELANIVRGLAEDRVKICELIRSASLSGRLYERDATMQRRIDLIRQYMNPPSSRDAAAG